MPTPPEATLKSVPPAIDPELERLAESVRGFLPTIEAQALYQAAVTSPSGTWLEIGTYCGKSTTYLGSAALATNSQLVTVDHHRGSEENQPGWEWHDETVFDPNAGTLDTLPHLRETLRAAGLESSVSVVVAPTQTVAAWWRSPVTFLFLDGNHTEEVAQHDYLAFATFVSPGGTLAVHDVFPDPADGGQAPWHVVERAIGSGAFEQVGQTDSLRILRRLPTPFER